MDAELSGIFSSALTLSFGLVVLVTGLFTAYFGAGRSRKIGLGLTIVALIITFVFASITWRIGVMGQVGLWDITAVIAGMAAVAGAAIGTFLALTLFLVSIMRA